MSTQGGDPYDDGPIPGGGATAGSGIGATYSVHNRRKPQMSSQSFKAIPPVADSGYMQHGAVEDQPIPFGSDDGGSLDFFGGGGHQQQQQQQQQHQPVPPPSSQHQHHQFHHHHPHPTTTSSHGGVAPSQSSISPSSTSNSLSNLSSSSSSRPTPSQQPQPPTTSSSSALNPPASNPFSAARITRTAPRSRESSVNAAASLFAAPPPVNRNRSKEANNANFFETYGVSESASKASPKVASSRVTSSRVLEKFGIPIVSPDGSATASARVSPGIKSPSVTSSAGSPASQRAFEGGATGAVKAKESETTASVRPQRILSSESAGKADIAKSIPPPSQSQPPISGFAQKSPFPPSAKPPNENLNKTAAPLPPTAHSVEANAKSTHQPPTVDQKPPIKAAVPTPRAPTPTPSQPQTQNQPSKALSPQFPPPPPAVTSNEQQQQQQLPPPPPTFSATGYVPQPVTSKLPPPATAANDHGQQASNYQPVPPPPTTAGYGQQAASAQALPAPPMGGYNHQAAAPSKPNLHRHHLASVSHPISPPPATVPVQQQQSTPRSYSHESSGPHSSMYNQNQASDFSAVTDLKDGEAVDLNDLSSFTTSNNSTGGFSMPSSALVSSVIENIDVLPAARGPSPSPVNGTVENPFAAGGDGVEFIQEHVSLTSSLMTASVVETEALVPAQPPSTIPLDMFVGSSEDTSSFGISTGTGNEIVGSQEGSWQQEESAFEEVDTRGRVGFGMSSLNVGGDVTGVGRKGPASPESMGILDDLVLGGPSTESGAAGVIHEPAPPSVSNEHQGGFANSGSLDVTNGAVEDFPDFGNGLSGTEQCSAFDNLPSTANEYPGYNNVPTSHEYPGYNNNVPATSNEYPGYNNGPSTADDFIPFGDAAAATNDFPVFSEPAGTAANDVIPFSSGTGNNDPFGAYADPDDIPIGQLQSQIGQEKSFGDLQQYPEQGYLDPATMNTQGYEGQQNYGYDYQNQYATPADPAYDYSSYSADQQNQAYYGNQTEMTGVSGAINAEVPSGGYDASAYEGYGQNQYTQEAQQHQPQPYSEQSIATNEQQTADAGYVYGQSQSQSVVATQQYGYGGQDANAEYANGYQYPSADQTASVSQQDGSYGMPGFEQGSYDQQAAGTYDYPQDGLQYLAQGSAQYDQGQNPQQYSSQEVSAQYNQYGSQGVGAQQYSQDSQQTQHYPQESQQYASQDSHQYSTTSFDLGSDSQTAVPQADYATQDQGQWSGAGQADYNAAQVQPQAGYDGGMVTGEQYQYSADAGYDYGQTQQIGFESQGVNESYDATVNNNQQWNDNYGTVPTQISPNSVLPPPPPQSTNSAPPVSTKQQIEPQSYGLPNGYNSQMTGQYGETVKETNTQLPPPPPTVQQSGTGVKTNTWATGSHGEQTPTIQSAPTELPPLAPTHSQGYSGATQQWNGSSGYGVSMKSPSGNGQIYQDPNSYGGKPPAPYQPSESNAEIDQRSNYSISSRVSVSADTIACPKCTKRIDADSAFCNKCGAQIPASATPLQGEPKFEMSPPPVPAPPTSFPVMAHSPSATSMPPPPMGANTFTPPPPMGPAGSYGRRDAKRASTPQPNLQYQNNLIQGGQPDSHAQMYGNVLVPRGPPRFSDPLGRHVGHALAIWGSNSKLLFTAPRTAQRLETRPDGKSGMVEKRFTGPISLINVQLAIADSELLSNVPKFPGPLLGGKSKLKKKDVVKVAEDMVEAAKARLEQTRQLYGSSLDAPQLIDAEDKIILIRLVKLVVESDGAILALKPDQWLQQLRALLLDPPRADGETVLDDIEIQLANGNRVAAYQLAISAKLSQALVIAAQIDKETYRQASSYLMSQELSAPEDMQETFSTSGKEVGTMVDRPSLRLLYSVFAGNGAKAPMEFGYKVNRKWREALATIIANRTPGDIAAIAAFGDHLRAIGLNSAAQICHMLSPTYSVLSGPDAPDVKNVLFGANHFTHPRSLVQDFDALHLTEIYEYGQAQANGGIAGGLPHLQPFKLAYASWLIDLGCVDVAQQYSDAITQIVAKYAKGSPYFHRSFGEQMKALQERLAALSVKGAGDSTEGGEGWFRFESILGKLVNAAIGESGQEQPSKAATQPKDYVSHLAIDSGTPPPSMIRPNSTPAAVFSTSMPPTVTKTASTPLSHLNEQYAPADTYGGYSDGYGNQGPSQFSAESGYQEAGSLSQQQDGYGGYPGNGINNSYPENAQQGYGYAGITSDQYDYNGQPQGDQNYYQGGYVDQQQTGAGEQGYGYENQQAMSSEQYGYGDQTGYDQQSWGQQPGSEQNGYHNDPNNYQPGYGDQSIAAPDSYQNDYYSQEQQQQQQQSSGYSGQGYDAGYATGPTQQQVDQPEQTNTVSWNNLAPTPSHAGTDRKATPTPSPAVEKDASTSAPPKATTSWFGGRASTSTAPPPARSQSRQEVVEDDDDLLGFGNKSLSKPKADESKGKEVAKSESAPGTPSSRAEDDNGSKKPSGFLSGFMPSLFFGGAKKDDKASVKKADLGEKTSLVFDPVLKKWIDPKSGSAPSETKEIPPPPMSTSFSAPTSRQGTPMPLSKPPMSTPPVPPNRPATTAPSLGNPNVSSSAPTTAFTSPSLDNPQFGALGAARVGSQAKRRGARNKYVDVMNPDGKAPATPSLAKSFIPTPGVQFVSGGDQPSAPGPVEPQTFMPIQPPAQGSSSYLDRINNNSYETVNGSHPNSSYTSQDDLTQNQPMRAGAPPKKTGRDSLRSSTSSQPQGRASAPPPDI
ncbi:hypothetical protein HDU76_005778 [Blyttiomyces sp. JEL0837]|nr:hypothetical protein HDU76_005778 [Blyttiomyces sp. JEL0837]